MSDAIVHGILEQIDQLSDDDWLTLSMHFARRTEAQWRKEADDARRVARDKGIAQSTIDQAVHQIRHGK